MAVDGVAGFWWALGLLTSIHCHIIHISAEVATVDDVQLPQSDDEIVLDMKDFYEADENKDTKLSWPELFVFASKAADGLYPDRFPYQQEWDEDLDGMVTIGEWRLAVGNAYAERLKRDPEDEDLHHQFRVDWVRRIFAGWFKTADADEDKKIDYFELAHAGFMEGAPANAETKERLDKLTKEANDAIEQLKGQIGNRPELRKLLSEVIGEASNAKEEAIAKEEAPAKEGTLGDEEL